MKLITCWSCNGIGTVSFASQNTAGLDIKCPRCMGTGKADVRGKRWEQVGARLRAMRIAQDRTLRDEAFLRNVPIIKYSQAERGIIDPETL